MDNGGIETRVSGAVPTLILKYAPQQAGWEALMPLGMHTETGWEELDGHMQTQKSEI